MPTLVEYSPNLQRAVDNALRGSSTSRMPPHRPGREIGTEARPVDTEYYGAFKVVPGETPGTYRCIDGGNPDSEYAGETDLGKVNAGAITTGDSKFYLYAWWSDGRYKQGFSVPAGASDYGFIQLAHLTSGAVLVQDYTTGFIHFSAFYTI